MMNPLDFTVGTRVCSNKRLGGNYPGASYNLAAGATGTVIEVFPITEEDIGGPFALVRLDALEPDLEEWDNVLHVFTVSGDALAEDFDPIIGFGT